MLTMLGWPQEMRDSSSRLPLQHCYGGVRIVDWPSPTNVRRLDLATLPMICEFHRNGILIDQSHFKSLESKVSAELAQVEADCWREAGRKFNPGSGDQVGQLLFEEMGLKPRLGIKRTPSGKVSTDADTLKQMRADYPVVDRILKYRELAKIKGTYIDTMPQMVGPDGRLRTTFRHTNTGTGRLSSEDPNLQNIPVRTELGKEIRNGFVARPGCRLGSIDLSQIEMVVAADLSLDRSLCRFFLDGMDIHTETALMAFGLDRSAVEWPNFKQDYRLPVKQVGFGILYGQTPAGAQENIISVGGPYKPIEEVEGIIRNWFLVYGGVARWMQQQYARVKRYGMAWDAFGRSRVIPEGRSVIPRVQSAGLRQAGNMPIQSTAGGILKLAMAELQDAVLDWRRAYPGEILEPLLQIHDELVFELSDSLAQDWCEYAKGVMTSAVRLTIPMGASASVGNCWGELK